MVGKRINVSLVVIKWRSETWLSKRAFDSCLFEHVG